MISNEWLKKNWGDIATLEYGKSLKDYQNSNGTVPVFGTNGRIGYTNKPLCSSPSIIIGRKGAYRGVHFSNTPFFVIDTAFYLKAIKTDELNIVYAYYQLLTQNINDMDSGSAIPSTSREDFYNLSLRLPPLETQNRIAGILSSLDDKLELNKQTNSTLEDILKILFEEWFINFNYPNSDGSRKHTEFGEIPADWKVSGIGDICYVQNGYAFKSEDFKEEGEVGIVKIKNINGNVVDIEKTDFVEASVIERLDKKFKIESKSLLIAMTGAQVGKVGLVPLTEKNLWLNQRVGMFKEKFAYGSLFMYLLLSSDLYQTNIKNSALGSAQPNISASAIESIRAIIPTVELVKQFGTIVTPMFEKILDNLAENETLKIIRDSLLPKLMSGEIDVNISNR